MASSFSSCLDRLYISVFECGLLLTEVWRKFAHLAPEEIAKLADVPPLLRTMHFLLAGPGTPAVLIDGGMHARSTKANIF